MPQSSPAKVLSVLEAKLELLPDVFEVGTEAECAIRVCHMSAGGAAGPLRARG